MERKYVEMIKKRTRQHWKIYVLSRCARNVIMDYDFLCTEIVCDWRDMCDNVPLNKINDAYVNIQIANNLLFTGTLMPGINYEAVLFTPFGDSISPFQLAKPYYIPKGANMELRGLPDSDWDDVWYGICGYPLDTPLLKKIEPHFFVFNCTHQDTGDSPIKQYINVPKNIDYFVFNTLHVTRWRSNLATAWGEQAGTPALYNAINLNIAINKIKINQVNRSRFTLQGYREFPRRFAPIFVPSGSEIEATIDTTFDTNHDTRYSVILGGYYILKV